MTIMMTSDMPGTTQADYEQLAAALLPLLLRARYDIEQITAIH